MRLPRFRISLFQVFLLLTATTLAISHFFGTSRVYKLEREIASLKSQLGKPIVRDRAKVAIGHMKLPDPDQWRFRVFKPDGERLVLRYRFANVRGAERNLKDFEGSFDFDLPAYSFAKVPPVQPQIDAELEFVVDVAVREDQNKVIVRCSPGPRFVIDLPEDNFLRRARKRKSSQIHFTPASQRDGLPNPLIAMHDAFSKDNDGLLIWLDSRNGSAMSHSDPK